MRLGARMQRHEALNEFGGNRGIKYLDLVAFVIPLTQFIKFNIIGQLYGPDIAYPALLLFLVLSSRGGKWPSEVRTGMILIALWFLGAVISDIYQSTSWADISRGWSKILLFAVIFIAIYRLVRNDLRRMLFVILGNGLGFMLEVLISPSELGEFDPWKFGVGTGVTVAIIFLASTVFVSNLFQRITGSLLIIGISFVSLALNVRELFGSAFITGIISLGKIITDSRATSRRITIRRFAMAIVLILSVVQGTLIVYSYAASEGILGLDAQDKYIAQTTGDLGILLSGRSEMLVSAQAIADSPIIGHGSWARDAYYVLMQRDLLEAKGGDVAYYGDFNQDDLIPSHSHLMGSWVEAGILGGVFWIWALIVCFRASFAMLKLRRPEMTLVAFALINLVWNILFSPFAAYMRFQTAAPLYLAILIIRQAKKSSQKVIYNVDGTNAFAMNKVP
jgi:hypothetical protein